MPVFFFFIAVRASFGLRWKKGINECNILLCFHSIQVRQQIRRKKIAFVNMLSLTLLRNTCSPTASRTTTTKTVLLSSSTSSFTSSAASSLSCFCFKTTVILFFVTILTSVVCGMQPSALGVHFERSPESAVAPKGDEVVFECETNLAPDRLQWKFRHSSNRSGDGSKFKYLEVSSMICKILNTYIF